MQVLRAFTRGPASHTSCQQECLQRRVACRGQSLCHASERKRGNTRCARRMDSRSCDFREQHYKDLRPLLPHQRDVLAGMRSPKDLGHLRTAIAHAAVIGNQGLPCKTTNWMFLAPPLVSRHADRCPRSLQSVLVQVLVLRPEGG
jgi:hypothetical protein